MYLPPGLSERNFKEALTELRMAIGQQWVFTSEDMLETYRDVYSPLSGTQAEPIASVAVAPANTGEVQKVVRIAAKYGIPFWTISTGKNFGLGGPAGIQAGTMTLDLKRMKRIIEINEQDAYVVVEPGVSFFELYRYIQEKRLKLWLDVPYPGWGSVLGNTIEYGTGYSCRHERAVHHCGMEVVLPDGELIRTGMGSLPNAATWHAFQRPYGPDVSGLFFQTNLGVVTRMGLWLLPEPEVYLACDVKAPGVDAIGTLIDTMRPMRQSGLISNLATIAPEGMFSEQGLDTSKPHPGWVNYLAFYGPGKVVDQQVECVMDHHAGITGVNFEKRRYVPPLNPEKMSTHDKVMAGIPTLILINHGVFFSPALPFSGEVVLEQIRVYDEVARRYGRQYIPGLYHAERQSIVPTPSVKVRQGDQAYNSDSLALAREWIKESAARGWGGYRVHTALMDDARAAYSFNDHSMLRFYQNLKQAIDPHGVMAPGKNGIWPKAMQRGQV